MKRQRPEEKLAKKRLIWTERTAKILDLSPAEAQQLLTTVRHQSLRINPLLTGQTELEPTLQALIANGLVAGQPYSWMSEGYPLIAPVANIRDLELVTAGKVFIQNAASWLPVLALDPQIGDYILDICAAPGGKTSHIAAITQNQAHIWANDNSRPRLAKLQANLNRLGARVEQYTLYDGTQLARKLEGQSFDRILLDAPCSGEGLMHIERDKDLATWSVAHIKRLQQLQKRIATQAWQLLKPGGTLVYSTCTMAPEEDEAVIDYLLRSLPDATLQPFTIDLPNKVAPILSWNTKHYDPRIKDTLRLKPSQYIEAFYIAKLRKNQTS